jgi:exopolyphosphatase/pppGpp-phosphohydrolase
MIKRYGVVEIGTRGVRLLIADASRLGLEAFVYSTGDFSDLGRYADKHGNLSKHSIDRVCQIVSRYIGMAEAKGADQLVGIATEGVRAAPNRDILLRTLAPLVSIKLLSSQEEAAYSFIACVDSFQHRMVTNAPLLVIDQGGGSTELTAGFTTPDGEIVLRDFVTLNLGTIGISKIFVEAATLGQAFEAARRLVQQELNLNPPLKSLAKQPPALTVGLGSAITQFMWEIMKGDPNRPAALHEVHGQPIQTETIAHQLERIERGLGHYTQDDFGADMYIGSELAVWLSGFITYYEILSYYGVPEIYVSRNGTRYGALLWQAGRQCTLALT